VQLQIPVTEGPLLQGRRCRVFRQQHRRPDRRPAPRCVRSTKTSGFNEKKIPQGLREGAGAVRQRGLLRVHGRAGVRGPERIPRRRPPRTARPTRAPARRLRRRPRLSAGPPSPTAPAGLVAKAKSTGPVVEHHDAPGRGQAVTCCHPDHLSRQYDDPRQRESGARSGCSKGACFNTEALKYSVRRLNPASGTSSRLERRGDRRPRRRPTRRRQVGRAAEVRRSRTGTRSRSAPAFSQYEGFFGQLAFQTSNFLGRGETFSVSAQQGKPREELPGGVHRAVPVRTGRVTRRHRRVQAGDSVHSGSSR